MSLRFVRKEKESNMLPDKTKHDVNPTMQSWLLKHSENFSISSLVLYCRGKYVL